MGSPPPSPSPVPSPCASGSPAPSLHRQPRLHLPHRGTSRLQLARSVSAKSDLSLAATTPADVTAAAAAAAVNAGTGTGESSDGPPAHAPLPAAVDYKGKGRATQDEQGVSDQPQGMVKVKDYALADDGDDDTTPAASTSSRPTSIDNREEEEDEVEMAAQPEGDVDPRTMLREQLKRSESARASASTSNSPRESAIPLPPRSRAQSYRSGLSVPRSAGEARADDTTLSPSDANESGLIPLQPRRYLVLTSAGKPVFASRVHASRPVNKPPSAAADPEDSEEALTSLVGVVQAIISLYAVENDRIRYIDAGSLRIAFLLKSPLYYVAVSSWGEPEPVLRTHLEYLHLQILSVVTHAQLQAIFAKRSNFDLRRLLEGTEGIMQNLLEGQQTDFESTMGALRVLPLELGLRDECAALLKPASKSQSQDILYALLVSKTTLVTLLRPKSHSIHPADLHILLNTLAASSSLRAPGSESWLPICLPKFNAKGFVYAFISYFARSPEEGGTQVEQQEEMQLGVVLVTTDREAFFAMKAWKDAIAQRLFQPSSSSSSSTGRSSLFSRLEAGHGLSRTLAPPVPALRHFIYKSRPLVQLCVPSFSLSSLYADGRPSMRARMRLVTLYQTVHEALHSPSASSGGGTPKLIYAVNKDEAVLGIMNSSSEAYLALPPLISKKVATDAAYALGRWVAKNESRLFLTSAPYF